MQEMQDQFTIKQFGEVVDDRTIVSRVAVESNHRDDDCDCVEED